MGILEQSFSRAQEAKMAGGLRALSDHELLRAIVGSTFLVMRSVVSGAPLFLVGIPLSKLLQDPRGLLTILDEAMDDPDSEHVDWEVAEDDNG